MKSFLTGVAARIPAAPVSLLTSTPTLINYTPPLFIHRNTTEYKGIDPT